MFQPYVVIIRLAHKTASTQLRLRLRFQCLNICICIKHTHINLGIPGGKKVGKSSMLKFLQLQKY